MAPSPPAAEPERGTPARARIVTRHPPPCRRALLRGHHCAITHPIPYTVSSKPSLKPSDLLSHPIAQRRHPRPHPFGPSSATATVHEVKSVNHRMYGLYAYWQQWRVKQDIVYQDLPLFYASWKRNDPSTGPLCLSVTTVIGLQMKPTDDLKTFCSVNLTSPYHLSSSQ